jgi:hypothetical protein
MKCLVTKLKATVDNPDLPKLANYFNNFIRGVYGVAPDGGIAFSTMSKRCCIPGTDKPQGIEVPVGSKIQLVNPTDKNYKMLVTDWDGSTMTDNVINETYYRSEWITSSKTYTTKLNCAMITIKKFVNGSEVDITPQDVINDGVYIKVE